MNSTFRPSESELREIMSRGGRGGKPPRQGLRSKLEGDLVAQLERISDLPEFEVNYRWHSVREWRWDVAFVDQKIAIEVDGTRRDGKGDHQTESGITNDCEKQAHGILWGWTVLRFTATMVKSGDAADLIMRVITRQAA